MVSIEYDEPGESKSESSLHLSTTSSQNSSVLPQEDKNARYKGDVETQPAMSNKELLEKGISNRFE